MKNLEGRLDDIERLCKEILAPKKKELSDDVLEICATAYKEAEKIRFCAGSPYDKALASKQRELESALLQEVFSELLKNDEFSKLLKAGE